MTTDQRSSDLLPLTGLWLNRSAKGIEYLSGSLGSCRVLIFPNGHRGDNDRAPTHTLYVAPAQRERPAGGEDGPAGDDRGSRRSRGPATAQRERQPTTSRGSRPLFRPDADGDADASGDTEGDANANEDIPF